MTKKIISNVQGYLTVIHDDGERVYQIVNVEFLLKRHPPEAVISFLQELYKDFGKQLKRALSKDKTAAKVNRIVVKRWRLKMAINTIRNNSKGVRAA